MAIKKTAKDDITANDESISTTESKPIKNLTEILNDVRKKAMSKRIVTITYNDKRDNDQVTTAFLTCENQYFAISRVVPLNIPVELEQCLVDNAKEAKILMHIPEIKDGHPTGTCRYRFANKYSVSYEDVQ